MALLPIEITVTNTGLIAKCGVCVIGTTQFIGEGIELGGLRRPLQIILVKKR